MTTATFNDSKNLNILAVDDEATVLKLYTSLLTSENHQVITASSGSEAIEKIKNDKIDIIFLDLKLPDMNGTELLEQVSDKLQWTPVVIVTANPTLDSSMDAIRSGVVHEYIVKPFDTDQLKLTIRRVFEKFELTIKNRRLLKNLMRANEALVDRVNELERFAKAAVDYETKIVELEDKLDDLEKKLK